jgi:tight adherence protein B
MAPGPLLSLTVAAAVLLIVAGVVLTLFGGRILAHRRAARRLVHMDGGAARPEVLDALRKEMDVAPSGTRRSLAGSLKARLRQADLAMGPERLLLVAGALAGAVFAALTTLTEAGLALRAVVSPAVAVLLLNAWTGRRIRTRLGAIEEALPDAVDLMVRSLRVGHPFASAVQIVAREVEGPLGAEMAVVAQEAAYGRDIGEALSEMAERVGLQDLRFLAVAVTIQRQAGGNLAEVLDGLAKVIRSRFRLFRRVKAITAEARFSGFFLSGFPVFATVGVNVVNPGYYDDIRETALFLPAVGIILAFLVGNVLVMRALVDIRV